MPWTALIGFAQDVTVRWLGNRREKSQAKHDAEMAVIRGEQNADAYSANDMRYSLKDEWLTVLLSVPLIVIFYSAVWGDPAQIEQVKLAFSAMSDLPEWFQWAFLGCVAATFGLRSVKSLGGK